MEKMPGKVKFLLGALTAFAVLIVLVALVNVSDISGLGANIGSLFGSQEEKQKQPGRPQLKEEPSLLGDIDKDGLFDQEEPVYRTDPLNPDTDGDGFLDGEEVAAGCSPLVSGPDDCTGKIKKAQSSKSLTEEISELIAGGLLTGDLKPGSPNFSKSILALRNTALQDSLTLLSVDTTEVNVNVGSDDSKGAQQAYADNLGRIIEKHLIISSDVSANVDFSSSNFIDDLFAGNLKETQKLYSEVIAFSVPPSWTEFHKKLLLFIRQSEVFYQNVLAYQEDPVKAFLTLSTLSSLQSDYQNLVSLALDKAREQNLTLSSTNILQLLSGQ